MSNSTAGEILTHWRFERALRVGRVLGLGGLFLSVGTTFADFYFENWSLLPTDLILVVGCALTYYWAQDRKRKTYFWWPLYLGYFVACIPTYFAAGGINGPLFAIGIALLYALGEVLDAQGRSVMHLLISAAHIPAFLIIESRYPLAPPESGPVAFTAVIIALNLAGVFICVRALLRTEEYLSEEFAQRQERTNEAQSIAKVGTWSWNIERDTIDWSDEIFRMFNIRKEDFDPSYKAYLARLSSEERAKIDRMIQDSTITGEDIVFEHTADSAEGVRHIYARGRVLKDSSNRAIGMMGTSQDVTERKKIEAELVKARESLEKRVEERTIQLEESLQREKAAKERAERASQAKMQFLANMSHEIRTPMNSILGFAEILATEKDLPHQARHFVKRIRANGGQLLRLIDDILDLSKFEAGQIPIEKSEVNIRLLVRGVINALENQARNKGLELVVSIDENLPEKILIDDARASQVLMNLIGNSIKFSDRGAVEVHVSVHGKSLMVGVIDSGMGIQVEHQKNLFQLFSQGDSSVARKYGGSGLGLALSKRICEALGGELILKWSEPGKGSHFEFQIPIEIVNQVRLASSSLNSPAPQKPSASQKVQRKILLAEDSEDNAYLISHFVTPLGYQLEVVGDGTRAVEAALGGHFDCVLMDIQMPGMDGLEATRRLRAAGFNKPIIALTAHALPSEAERSLAAGCDMHLTKPISSSVLTETLRSLET